MKARMCAVITAIAATVMTLPVRAQIPTLDEQLQQWQQMPEDPGMKEVCVNDLRWSTEIANRRAHGATVIMLIRWAEQEAEVTAKHGGDQFLPVGTERILLEYIERSYFDYDIYKKIPGGFVRWVYGSCLKGEPLYEKSN